MVRRERQSIADTLSLVGARVRVELRPLGARLTAPEWEEGVLYCVDPEKGTLVLAVESNNATRNDQRSSVGGGEATYEVLLIPRHRLLSVESSTGGSANQTAGPRATNVALDRWVADSIAARQQEAVQACGGDATARRDKLVKYFKERRVTVELDSSSTHPSIALFDGTVLIQHPYTFEHVVGTEPESLDSVRRLVVDALADM